MLKVTVFIALLLSTSFAVAESKTKLVGNWITTQDVDPMDDSKKYIALTPDSARDYAFGVRCFNKDLSYMIIATDKSDNGFENGQMYEVKLRPDQGSVTTFKAIGDDAHSLLVEESEDILKTIISVNTKFAIRITSDKESRQRDLVFNVSSTKAALAPIQTQCAVK